jgi:hypothetical protein
MLAATLDDMAQDKHWLQYPAKAVCRNMAKPEAKDCSKVNRIVRLRTGTGQVMYTYRWQNEDESRWIMIYVDSN